VSADAVGTAWDDGVVQAIAAVRLAATKPEHLAAKMHALLLDMQDKHGPDGLLVVGTALAWIAGNAVSAMAAAGDRPVSDVLDQMEMSAISSAFRATS
jgi:cobalamin biosynthesis Mg chelatase CobN